MIWEIVNPSDAYTIEHQEFLIAAAATILLGEGAYGLRSEDGEQALPILILSSASAWLGEQGITDFDAYVTANKPAIADALDSVMIGGAADRRRMQRVLAEISSAEERDRAAAAWHEERRSSLNDIGARAKKYAKALRKRPETT